jgi:TetR/AcrR family transcriptional regulator, transcriptional repressor for nem operon
MLSKSERTKLFIIEKTAPLFNKKGYAGTSLNDMISVTGLTKGSIYGNFKNKDEVALASFDFNFQLVAAHIRKEMSMKKSVIDKLLVYPETYRNFSKLSFLHHGCPITNTSTEADDTHPLLREKAMRALIYWKNTVKRHLESGIQNNEIKSNINVHEVVAVFVSIIQGGVMQAKVLGKTDSLDAAMNFLERMIKEMRK